jgi:hypothetical protein
LNSRFRFVQPWYATKYFPFFPAPLLSRYSPFARPGALTGDPDGTRTRHIKKIIHGNEHRSRRLRAGKLKNWKSEKLASRPATGPTRISAFQDFRFSARHLLPENLAG